LTTSGSGYEYWIFDVIYEFKIDGRLFTGIKGGLFEEDGFVLSIPIVHDSPNKIGKNKVYPEIGEEIESEHPE